jgi:hypothetical protein
MNAVVSRVVPVAAMVVALLALIAPAGCGGAGSEQHKIVDVLRTGLTSQDPSVVCEGSLTPALLTRIYGGVGECHVTEGEPGERVSQALSVDVSRVHVASSRATAVVRLHGGSHDGARGALTLSRHNGAWRVSDLSVGLLRSQFEATMRRAQGLVPGAGHCITDFMRRLDDARFRRLAMSAGDAGRRRVASIARHCFARMAAVGRLQV